MRKVPRVVLVESVRRKSFWRENRRDQKNIKGSIWNWRKTATKLFFLSRRKGSRKIAFITFAITFERIKDQYYFFLLFFWLEKLLSKCHNGASNNFSVHPLTLLSSNDVNSCRSSIFKERHKTGESEKDWIKFYENAAKCFIFSFATEERKPLSEHKFMFSLVKLISTVIECATHYVWKFSIKVFDSKRRKTIIADKQNAFSFEGGNWIKLTCQTISNTFLIGDKRFNCCEEKLSAVAVLPSNIYCRL